MSSHTALLAASAAWRLPKSIVQALPFVGSTEVQSRLRFCSLCAGFVAFVLKLKKGYYLYQFGQYAWTHLILLFVFVPSSFFVANIFDGIIWFLLPCSLVIINDIGAYLAGELLACTGC